MCLGVVPYSSEYEEELMGVYFHEDFIDGMGEINAEQMKNALDKAYALQDKIKQVVKDKLPEEHKHYADKMKVMIWAVIPW